MPVQVTEDEFRELAGYLTAQLQAQKTKNVPLLLAAKCAVVSFSAEHGPAKAAAIAAEMDRRTDLALTYEQVIKTIKR